MFDTRQTNSQRPFRTKDIVFAFIAVMMVYVIYNNERFLLDPEHPVWQHYETFKWWLLPHGLAGGAALLLAPLQFSDRLRTRYAKLHRVVGRIYVAGVLILAPFGAYIQYLEEPLGAPRSFTFETIVQSSILMITTILGLIFAMKRMIPQHRQWMFRSYAAALTFFEIRFFMGVMGWELGSPVTETVVWTCTATSVLVGDIAHQIHELKFMRPRAVRAPAAQLMAAE
jgi:uncharacterized membrane protein